MAIAATKLRGEHSGVERRTHPQAASVNKRSTEFAQFFAQKSLCDL
jgi:hypothetical protein